MKGFKYVLAATVLLASNMAAASGVARCDYCANPRSVALNGYGTGLVLVADYPAKRLSAFDVQVERERGFSSRNAYPTSVPGQYQALFDRELSSAKISSTVYFDNRGAMGPFPYYFPSDFTGSSAYGVLSSGTQTSQFLTQAAISVVPPDGLAQTLVSMAYGVLSPIGLGFDQVTFVFPDGSKITVRVDAENMNKAKLISAEDKDGNPLALPLPTPGGGLGATNYSFSSEFGALQWIDLATMQGVTVIMNPGARRYSCTWVNTTLTCKWI